ncbi:hypothetical protein Salat_1556700 [Sesamum alatum]|uniref:Uncharacterized protein n=1 Tax=Sesamum alatum TaxID=300844 RepID=A0AAE2CMQ7_9LAMI|nr:hypothetical protein Salat_1556700 [Sesamum alatum]
MGNLFLKMSCTRGVPYIVRTAVIWVSISRTVGISRAMRGIMLPHRKALRIYTGYSTRGGAVTRRTRVGNLGELLRQPKMGILSHSRPSSEGIQGERTLEWRAG